MKKTRRMRFDKFLNIHEISGYTIYIVRHIPTNAVLYVGMTEDNVWNRWFSCRSPHIELFDGKLYPRSAIGVAVCRNLLEHEIELWDDEELAKQFPRYDGRDPWTIPVKYVEVDAIRKYKPYYNVQHAEDWKYTPEEEAAIDAYKAYNETFNQRAI